MNKNSIFVYRGYVDSTTYSHIVTSISQSQQVFQGFSTDEQIVNCPSYDNPESYCCGKSRHVNGDFYWLFCCGNGGTQVAETFIRRGFR